MVNELVAVPNRSGYSSTRSKRTVVIIVVVVVSAAFDLIVVTNIITVRCNSCSTNGGSSYTLFSCERNDSSAVTTAQ